VFDDAEALARAVSEAFVASAAESIERRGEFRVALSGGRTPGRAYEILGRLPRGRVDWARVAVLFADERAVAPDDPESNYRLVRETLIDPAGIEADRVHRLRGEADDLDAAAREAEPDFERPLDLLLLGIGPDAHIASIFPGSPTIGDRGRRVVAVHDSPKPPPRRLTITPRVIEEARRVWVLATGREKGGAVAAALEGEVGSLLVPAKLAGLAHRSEWYLDRDAAAELQQAAE